MQQRQKLQLQNRGLDAKAKKTILKHFLKEFKRKKQRQSCQITIAALVQPLQYDWRCPAAKDTSIAHAAAAPSSLDAAITCHYNAFSSLTWPTRTSLRTWQQNTTTITQPLHCDLPAENQETQRTTQTWTTTQCRTQRRNWSRPKRSKPHPPHTHEVPFIAGCSHFTGKNTRFRALAFSPNDKRRGINLALFFCLACSFCFWSGDALDPFSTFSSVLQWCFLVFLAFALFPLGFSLVFSFSSVFHHHFCTCSSVLQGVSRFSRLCVFSRFSLRFQIVLCFFTGFCRFFVVTHRHFIPVIS